MLAALAVEIPACLAVFMRLYSRWYTSMSWKWDDWIMALVAVRRPCSSKLWTREANFETQVLFLPFFFIGQYGEWYEVY